MSDRESTDTSLSFAVWMRMKSLDGLRVSLAGRLARAPITSTSYYMPLFNMASKHVHLILNISPRPPTTPGMCPGLVARLTCYSRGCYVSRLLQLIPKDDMSLGLIMEPSLQRCYCRLARVVPCGGMTRKLVG